MSQGNSQYTTSVKIRFPNEVLEALDRWASINNMPRSVAVRRLMFYGLVSWEGDHTSYQQEFGDDLDVALGDALGTEHFLEAAE